MRKSEIYDVIIVGSGATGGWATKTLTERGLRVLLLEAGSPLLKKNISHTQQRLLQLLNRKIGNHQSNEIQDRIAHERQQLQN